MGRNFGDTVRRKWLQSAYLAKSFAPNRFIEQKMFETVKLYRAYYYYYYCLQRFLWPAYLLEITPGYGGSATGIRKKNFAKLFTGKMPFFRSPKQHCSVKG